MVKKGYKQTEIGVIPEDWNISTLEMQYNITSSKRVFQSEWRDSGVPFYRAREIAVMGEGVPAPKDLYISEKMYEQYSKQYGAIKENDVLITGVGTLGKVYVVKKDDRFYFKDGNIIWLQWNGRYSSQFLKQLYRTPVLTDQVFGNAGGSTVPTYTITNAKATVVPCPAYQEQCDIAEVLSDTDELIATIEKQISKKKAIKQGAMQELLTGKRRLPGFSGNWQTISLKKALSVGHGMSQHDVACPTGRYPILATGGVIGRANRYLWNAPSVLIGRKGTINKPQYMDKPFWSIDTLFYTKINEGYCPKFLYYVFCRIDWLSYNEASGVPSLSSKTIESIEVQVPDYREQCAIAGALTDIDTEIEALEQKSGKYRQVKQGMMQQLLTGKIRLM